MPRLSDIARQMGLSTATVSNAFTGKGRMRPETRSAIIEQARSLGYIHRPRPKAEKQFIAVTEAFRPFGAHMLEGARQFAQEQGFTLPVYALPREKGHPIYTVETETLNRNVRKILDGIHAPVGGVLYICEYARVFENLLPDLGIPVVPVFCTREKEQPFVHYDDRQGAHLAVQHLIRSGRKRIAMISGPINSIGMFYRTSGYQRALVDSGLPYDPTLTRIGNWDRDSGYALTLALLREHRDIDGIFAQNDRMAIGAIDAARQLGLGVPEDIAVIGFDDTASAELHSPSLTSIAPPFEEMGRTGLEMLLRLIGGEPPESRILPCRLIARESTAPVKNKLTKKPKGETDVYHKRGNPPVGTE